MVLRYATVSFLSLILETMKHLVLLSQTIIDCRKVSGSFSFCYCCAGQPTPHGQEGALKATGRLHKSFKTKHVGTWVQFLLLSKLRIFLSDHVSKSILELPLAVFVD